jgi:hypothetical protein
MRCLWITTKAKHSRCKVCQESITEAEADSYEFQEVKTSRGVLLRIYQVLSERKQRAVI